MSAMDLRTVVLVGALGLAAGWVMGGRDAVTPQARATVSRGPRPIGVETPAIPTASTRDLRRKLERQTEHPRPSRNPFVFASRRPTTVGDAPRVASETAAPASESPAEPLPEPAGVAYQLAGVASSDEGDTLVRTAIVSGGPALLFVKQGDTLPGGWTVAEVDGASVVLVDGAGSQRVLRLP
jgi:hypothetical protein